MPGVDTDATKKKLLVIGIVDNSAHFINGYENVWNANGIVGLEFTMWSTLSINSIIIL